MCIALISTVHPDYSLILLDNRDEFLNRPTAKAEWWPAPHSKVLGGRDLLRDTQGTWLGISKDGRIAVLTNFREDVTPPPTAVSRGAIIRKFLTEDIGTTEEFVESVIKTGVAKDAGGFSLVCGRVGEKLAVVSNRAEDQSQVPWIAGDIVQTVGLSNAAFTNRTWKKVNDGEELMLDAIRASIETQETEDELIKRFLQLLSRDTLPRKEENNHGGLDTYINQLRNTILVPALGRKDRSSLPPDEIAAARQNERAEVLNDAALKQAKQLGFSGLYGTQKQAVILVDRKRRVRFFERTLYDNDSSSVPTGQGDVDIEFEIER